MKFKKCKLIRDGTDPEDMFRIRFPNGDISLDFYNLSRAKDHVAKINSTLARQKPLEGRRCV